MFLPVFGYAIPNLLLYSRGIERQTAIQRELPNTLDQLLISVEAGLGFEAAESRAATTLGRLAAEIGDPGAATFARGVVRLWRQRRARLATAFACGDVTVVVLERGLPADPAHPLAAGSAVSRSAAVCSPHP